MFDILSAAIVVICAGGAWFAFAATKDAMHPAVIISPLLGYVYGVRPLVLNADSRLEALFQAPDLIFVGSLYAASVLSFLLGIARSHHRRSKLGRLASDPIRSKVDLFLVGMTPAVRRRVLMLSLVLGFISLAAYIYSIENAGGFLTAYGRAKGGGRAGSGYVGEAVLLSYPAIMLLALSRQGSGKVGFGDVILALSFAVPQLATGILGGRRGPLFLVLVVLLLGWFVARGTRPSLRKIIISLGVIGLSVILVQSQRHHLYLGSSGQFDISRFVETVSGEGRIEDNDYVAGVASVLTVRFFGDHYWGYRYFVTLFIRPIPKQIWPTKYEDVGADWIYLFDPDEGGERFRQSVGFAPPAGSAVGFIADIYHEFAWGVLVVVYLFGRGLNALWARHRVLGGLWTVLFAEAVILSIYLPTQSFSAWFHRFLFMAIITTIVWKMVAAAPRRRYQYVAYDQRSKRP